MTYLDCWISTASTLCSQMLAGEAKLRDCVAADADAEGLSFVATLSGDVAGEFTVTLQKEILNTPLLGESVDQASAWEELLREVASAAAGELTASSGQNCRVETFHAAERKRLVTRALKLESPQGSWAVLLHDETSEKALPTQQGTATHSHLSGGVDLFLDVELDATLRFGCREMPLGEILELGPGDVIELDRHTAEPADLIVGDKIVARGEVVLINGNFGLRISEVATPQKRLESIRCPF